ncbi:hypothetical protein D9758_000052 [Tetrapyrgos nigripes]|uniref:Protein kinase domain-containing protein n=1 Tax=Tetrapyrgos nigripes TaxID=182062 RepID=A0A8H5LZA2_9AGAR|nr:hypothetical protein D9758_000052 [Tetrapyrgos nigripes]
MSEGISRNVHQPAFIGAVEDLWELYRCASPLFILCLPYEQDHDSDDPADYTLGAPIGFGASSIVYQALYQPRNKPRPPIPVALKVLDLDSLPPHSLALLQRETTLMSLSKHHNVLRVRGSWMDGHKLFIALRLMNKGSAADVMHYGWPSGFEEAVIKCILSQALQGLNYLHINGFIHRDIKAANLLIDDDGTVLLGDLGVAADLSEDVAHPASFRTRTPAAHVEFSRHPGSPSPNDSSKHVTVVEPVPVRPKMGKRKSFVGTPCWMAPELIQGKQYDSSADIWSFGITALELSQGRPPRSRESPQKVLLKTIQEAPPTLNRDGGTYKYSRAFQEMIESCLVKDPSKRPTAEQLLQSPFFKGTKKKSCLIGAILKDLPPLASRQERRLLPKNAQTTRNSIDSWDFSTLQLSGMGRTQLLEETAVFEMDDGTDNSRHRSTAGSFHSSHSSHSRSISWAGREMPLELPEDTEVSSSVDHSSQTESSSQSPSFSTPSSEPETCEDESLQPSPPSEPEKDGVEEATVTTIPEAIEAISSSPETNLLASSQLQGTPPTEPVLSSSAPSSSVLNKSQRLSSSPVQNGFWSKIKYAAGSNLKRATSLTARARSNVK